MNLAHFFLLFYGTIQIGFMLVLLRRSGSIQEKVCLVLGFSFIVERIFAIAAASLFIIELLVGWKENDPQRQWQY